MATWGVRGKRAKKVFIKAYVKLIDPASKRVYYFNNIGDNNRHRILHMFSSSSLSILSYIQ